MSILRSSQNLMTPASTKSLASSTAALAVSLFPESLLDLERPLNLERALDLDLVLDLDNDLGRPLLRLPDGDLDRDLEPDEVELLLLDLVSSPSSMSIICTNKSETDQQCKIKDNIISKKNSS